MLSEIKEIKIKQIDAQIEELERQYNQQKTDDIYSKLKSLKMQKDEKISTATTLDDLGLNFEEAVQILQENNIPLILNEQDKAIAERRGEFQELEDFMLVHVTRFAPTEGKIKSPKEASAVHSGFTIMLGEKKYTYDFPYMRDTVHFTVNNEVNTDHGYLNCDDCRYAVLIPIVDIPTERLKGEAADLYTVNGGANLTANSYILCPRGEAEELMKKNPGVNVIEYEGESVRGYAASFLSTLGYRQSVTISHDFRDEKDSSNFLKIMKEHGIESSAHFVSEERNVEGAYDRFEQEIAIYRIIKENGLIQNETDMSKIMEQLRKERIILEENRALKYKILTEEQKKYFLKRCAEEKLDLTSIIEEDGEWRSGDIVQITVKGLFSEKVQAASNDLENALKLWEKGCNTRRRKYKFRPNL